MKKGYFLLGILLLVWILIWANSTRTTPFVSLQVGFGLGTVILLLVIFLLYKRLAA